MCKDLNKQLRLGHPTQQRGAALVVSLIFLLLLTILGVTTMSTNTLQEKMAGNLKDQEISHQTTESALAYAEYHIMEQHKAIAGSSENAEYFDPSTNKIWPTNGTDVKNTSWWSSNKASYAGSKSLSPPAAANPEFIIEKLHFVKSTPMIGSPELERGTQYYLVTAKGVGATSTAQTMLETTFSAPF